MKFGHIIARIHAEVDGVKYAPGPIKASEAEKITAWTGYGLREWEAKLVYNSDPAAARALVALAKFRQGENVRFTAVEIEDVDSVSAEFRDESGRLVDMKVDGEGDPVLVGGKPVFLLDGEEADPPPVASPST